MKRLSLSVSSSSVFGITSAYSAIVLSSVIFSSCQVKMGSNQGSETSSVETRSRLSLSSLEEIDKEKSNELVQGDGTDDAPEDDTTNRVPCNSKFKIKRLQSQSMIGLLDCNDTLIQGTLAKEGYVFPDLTFADIRSRLKGPGDLLLENPIKNLNLPDQVSRIRFEDLFYELPDPSYGVSKEQFKVPLIVNAEENVLHIVLDQAAYNPKVIYETGGGFSVIYDQVLEVQKGGTIKVVNSPRIERFNNEGIRQSSVDVKAVMGLDSTQVVKFDAFSEVNSETMGALGSSSAASQTGALVGSLVIDGVSKSVKVGSSSLSTLSSQAVSSSQMSAFQTQAAARGFRAR